MYRDEFMEATTDVWEHPAESATQVNHPAPFPVDASERLIHLYTYRETSCSTRSWVRARRRSRRCAPVRHFVGYETDDDVCAEGA